MRKLLGLAAILGAIYLGLQVYQQRGGDAFEPIQTSQRDSSPFGGQLIGGDVTMPAERDKSHTTGKVRDQLEHTRGLGR